MIKPRDVAHQTGTGDEELDPASPKQVDLHRYQVMTIPIELQQELASLKGPRLTDEDMMPPPPLEEVVKAHHETPSKPSRAAIQVIAKHWVLFLITVLTIAIASILLHRGTRDDQPLASSTVADQANQRPATPIPQHTTPQQSAPPNEPSHPQKPVLDNPEPIASVKPAQKPAALPKPAASSKSPPPRRFVFKPE